VPEHFVYLSCHVRREKFLEFQCVVDHDLGKADNRSCHILAVQTLLTKHFVHCEVRLLDEVLDGFFQLCVHISLNKKVMSIFKPGALQRRADHAAGATGE
jgi:hypothetical protein